MATNYNRLPIFAEVVLSGSISLAAQHLGMTQSAVSQQIARFEDELGTQLLERVGRTVRPTEAGLRIAKAGDLLLNIDGYIEGTLRDLSKESGDRLDMFCFRSASLSLLPPALKIFSEEQPDVQLSVREVGSAPEIVRLWQEGNYDLALVHEQSFFSLDAAEDVVRTPLVNEPMALLMSRKHHLAKRSAVSLAELRDEYWVTEQQDSVGGFSLARAAESVGFIPRMMCQSSALEVAVHLAAAGGGIALVPTITGPPRPPGSVLVPLVEPEIHRNLLTMRPKRPVSHATKAMQDALRLAADAVMKRRH